MKKIILTIFFGLLLSCSDADVVIEPFDFEQVGINNCITKDVLYKIKSTELLVVSFPFETYLKNEITTTGTPRVAILNSANKVFYRIYNGTVNSTVICGTIPPATPSTQAEWIAQDGGTILIETTYVTISTGNYYKHKITFKNIEFKKGTESFVFDTYEFGEYKTYP